MQSPESSDEDQRDVRLIERRRDEEPLDDRDLGWEEEDPADRRKDPLRRP